MSSDRILSETPPSGNHKQEELAPDPGANRLAKPQGPSLDSLDIGKLRLSQDFMETVGVKRALLHVPVRRPAKEWWVRCHPEESYQMQWMLLELKEERELYFPHPDVLPELMTESTLVPKLLVTSITRQNVVFLWEIRMPGSDGRLDEWNRSAMEAADRARHQWVRVAANRSLGAYDCFTTSADLPDPAWPELTFDELVKIAFKDRYIATLDHPILQKLRGEA